MSETATITTVNGNVNAATATGTGAGAAAAAAALATAKTPPGIVGAITAATAKNAAAAATLSSQPVAYTTATAAAAAAAALHNGNTKAALAGSVRVVNGGGSGSGHMPLLKSTTSFACTSSSTSTSSSLATSSIAAVSTMIKTSTSTSTTTMPLPLSLPLPLPTRATQYGQIDKPPNNNNNMDNVYTSIPDFYAGRSVFITGGTGFMGKVLIEKLLRSCPNIRNIYVLIRPRKELQAPQRLEKILNSPLFEQIHRERPEQLKKVLPIDGDITKEILGISAKDQALLCREVSIVFHSAATVKFDEKLKISVMINMMGTKRLVALCQDMKKLSALIHVSTAYCNCDRSTVSEEIYAPPYLPEHIMSLVNWMPEDMLDQLTPRLIGDRPNTYTFTKALAEQMLLKEASNLPVAIVRPSIVTASLNEPFAGWVDNHNGPTGLVSALGKGLFRSMMCEKDFVADMVPVDVVINLMIAAAWRTAICREQNNNNTNNNNNNKIHIYNCCTGKQHPITWAKFVKYAMAEVRKHPLEGCVWYPCGELRMNRTMHKINCYILHMIPAYIYDIFNKITGRTTPIGSMVTIQRRIAKAVECLEYFSTRQWHFDDNNVQSLLKTLSAQDRQTFIFDVRTIDWAKYVEEYVLGFRQFLFKQSPKTLPDSRRHMRRLYWIHQISKFVLAIGAFYYVTRNTQIFNNVLNAFWRSFLRFFNLKL